MSNKYITHSFIYFKNMYVCDYNQGLSPRDIALESGNQRMLYLFRRDFGYKKYVSLQSAAEIGNTEANESLFQSLFIPHCSFVSYLGGVIAVHNDYLDWNESQTSSHCQVRYSVVVCIDDRDSCYEINIL